MQFSLSRGVNTCWPVGTGVSHTQSLGDLVVCCCIDRIAQFIFNQLSGNQTDYLGSKQSTYFSLTHVSQFLSLFLSLSPSRMILSSFLSFGCFWQCDSEQLRSSADSLERNFLGEGLPPPCSPPPPPSSSFAFGFY